MLEKQIRKMGFSNIRPVNEKICKAYILRLYIREEASYFMVIVYLDEGGIVP